MLERKRLTHELGPITTRGKRPPANIEDEAAGFMITVNNCSIAPEHIVTIAEFIESIYLPWVAQYKRPSTLKGYRDIWEDHLKALASRERTPLKNIRTFHVQQWLDAISDENLSRNTLKHIKSVISGIFTLAKNRGYYDGVNPAQGTTIAPDAREPEETYAYSLDEVRAMLTLLPEPISTAFAIAAFAGLRHGEIQGLLWEDYRSAEFKDSNGETSVRDALWVSRSIWNGREGKPKTGKSQAPVPVIRQLAERLELHRLRCGSPELGPIFRNIAGKPMALTSVVNRIILPTLNKCETCRKSELEHKSHPVKFDHQYVRDTSIPEWRGWHAGRRGLGSNLYHLGVPEKVIQAILRHSNVSITMTYYVKPLAQDVCDGMAKLEEKFDQKTAIQNSRDTDRTVNAPAAARSSAIH